MINHNTATLAIELDLADSLLGPVFSVMMSATKHFQQAFTRLRVQKLKLPTAVIERFK